MAIIVIGLALAWAVTVTAYYLLTIHDEMKEERE